MISAKRIGELIVNPNLVQKEEIEGLEKAVQKYQYSSALRFLILKAKTKFHSADLEKELETSANFVADREYLYQFLHEETTQKTEVKEKKEVVEEIKIETTPIEVVVEEEVVEVEKVVPIEAKVEKETIEIKEEPVSKVVEEVVEKEEIEVKWDSVEEVLEEPVLVKEESPIEKAEKIIIEEEVIKPIKKAVAIDVDKLSFVEWLKLQKEGGGYIEEAPLVKESVPAERVGKEVKAVLAKSSKLTKTDINDLLDKFIEAEPSISKPDREFYNPAKTAKQSLEEQESLVTETLAKIHLLQKNYSKAIETYRRLILVYPEKKTYFATQIEKIRGFKSDKED